MSSDEVESRRQQSTSSSSTAEDEDRPPPIPPRPSFTFTHRSQHRGSVPPVAMTANSTSSDTASQVTSAERNISNDVNDFSPSVPHRHRGGTPPVATTANSTLLEHVDRQTDTASQVTSTERQISNDVNDVRPAVPRRDGIDAGRPSVPHRRRVAPVATTGNSTSSEQADSQTDVTSTERQISNDVSNVGPAVPGVENVRPLVPPRSDVDNTGAVLPSHDTANNTRPPRVSGVKPAVPPRPRNSVSGARSPVSGVSDGRPVLSQQDTTNNVTSPVPGVNAANPVVPGLSDGRPAVSSRGDVDAVRSPLPGTNNARSPVPVVNAVRPAVPPRRFKSKKSTEVIVSIS